MRIISIFFPALISLKIFCRRNGKQDILQSIIMYGIFSLIQNFITWTMLVFGLGVVVDEDAFMSMQFEVKYIPFAVIIAILLPFAAEIVKKYLKVSVSIDEKNSKN